MKQRTSVVLLATFVSAGAWAQEINTFSTTMVQLSKQTTPGFDSKTLAPATEFLGIDATKLGSDALSLHLFGWGYRDLADASMPSGKSGGDLSYAYLDYRFSKANAEVKAGRFSINQGAGIEQVDGVSGRTDLRGGFNVSAFFGVPIHYRAEPPIEQKNYKAQTDIIYGGRLGLRMGPVGEVGVSYLQDGSKSASQFPNPPAADYTRKQVGADIRIAPIAKMEFTGHTLINVASRYQAPAAPAGSASRVAEHDYSLSYKFTSRITAAGNYTERNLDAYFAGTNLPNLFNHDEKDKHKGYGGTLTVTAASAKMPDVTLDYRRTERQTFGNAKRYGADLRWAGAEAKVKGGFGLHKVDADKAVVGDVSTTLYGMSREEARAWVMVEKGKFNASLDGIYYHFSDDTNPNLNGKSGMGLVVASMGMRPTENLSVSGDLSYGADAFYQNQTSLLLRTTYRFSVASKGGK